MKLRKPNADVFIPDGAAVRAALARTTHMGIGAHQDDLETIAIHGIVECFGRAGRSFAGVTCTDGAGSPRAGVYADYSDEDMKKVRFGEQRAAALAGRYGAMIQLGYASREVKGPEAGNLVGELAAILRAARPETVYTHNLADKHDTHVAVALAAMGAIRSLRPADRPKRVYGCEVWRDLDWLPDARKIALPLAGHENLETALLGVFDSQIAGGKRYDLAIPGRRRSNATFLQSHGVDTAERMIFAMDLTPLARDPSIAPADYVAGLVAEFSADVADRFGRLGGAQ